MQGNLLLLPFFWLEKRISDVAFTKGIFLAVLAYFSNFTLQQCLKK
jgi:hypothetical protein